MFTREKEVSPRQDIACRRCRERKIRCGRQRPACLGCQQDGHDCDYSLPEKRVNHAKLLCNNFDRLEQRLQGIEEKLSWLTDQLKPQRIEHGTMVVEEKSENATESADIPQLEVSEPVVTTISRVIRGTEDQGDHYHGPGTLLSLCYELKRDIVASEDTIKTSGNGSPVAGQVMGHFDNGTYSSEYKTHSIFSTGDTSSEVLERLCFSARDESPLKAVENLTIGLPPKQLVLMVLPQFFAQVDYQTDLFIQTHLLAEIERIYSRSAIVATDAWAICFNTIILLVIGPEGWTHGHGPSMVSQFTLPLFQAMRAALNQAHLLTIPKLINVQALALLSIAAEKYYSAATSTAIFAQACLLGRRTGLHQARNTTGDVSQDESIERYKTFVSLHLRDKSQSLSISSICWLPSFDHGSHLETIPFMFADARIAQRVQLADIQEQLYRCISTEPRQQPQRSSSDLLSICRELESWSNGQDGQESSAHPFQSIHEAEYQLTFLATRMLAFSRSPDSVHGQAMLADARASCLILLISCEKHDQGMIRMLQSLGRLARIPTQSASPPKHKSVDSRNTSSLSTGSFMFMANAFPAISVFQMAKRIFLSQDQNETKSSDAATISDFELLQNVYDCMVRANSQGQCQNRSKQMERTLECLLELIQVKKRGPLSPSPTYDITIPSPQVETPHTSAALGFGLGGFPVNAAAIPRTTNVPWDFMTSPVSDVMICVGAEAHPEDMEPRKKRPRTSETEFCVDRDLGLLDGGWGEPAILL